VASNDAGKGAAIGATAGVLAAGRQSRMAQSHKQQQAAQQSQANAEQAKAEQQELANSFKKGMSVCLEARGYSVK
jgi:gas vesicle protein